MNVLASRCRSSIGLQASEFGRRLALKYCHCGIHVSSRRVKDFHDSHIRVKDPFVVSDGGSFREGGKGQENIRNSFTAVYKASTACGDSVGGDDRGTLACVHLPLRLQFLFMLIVNLIHVIWNRTHSS